MNCTQNDGEVRESSTTTRRKNPSDESRMTTSLRDGDEEIGNVAAIARDQSDTTDREFPIGRNRRIALERRVAASNQAACAGVVEPATNRWVQSLPSRTKSSRSPRDSSASLMRVRAIRRRATAQEPCCCRQPGPAPRGRRAATQRRVRIRCGQMFHPLLPISAAELNSTPLRRLNCSIAAER